ncbi:MAG: hypothetical protein KC469_01200 [Flavobacteriaceae bacterium]|nr:hypothetical protein [Flavobacteriaceae bacterium]
MATSILIAKILATVYFSFSLGLIFSSSYYKEKLPKLVDNTSYLLLGGFMAIVFGYLILEFHNHWRSDWTVIITICGWISLVKGIVLFAFPQMFSTNKTPILKAENQKYILVLLIILSVFFGYYGFFAT